jgi:Phage capsid family.
MSPAPNGGGFNEDEQKFIKDAFEITRSKIMGELGQKFTELEQANKANQDAVDLMLTRMKEMNSGAFTNKMTFGEAFKHKLQTEFEGRKSEFENFIHDKHARLKIDLKTVGDMSTGNITGDGVATYGSRQGIVPSQKVNLRDLIPVVESPTGLYVSYRETGTEGGIGIQTEGNEKSQIDYDFTELKQVQNYIAGFARFSKQLMTHLPFLMNTLPRMLQRDFYKKENDYFWDVFATNASGFSTTVETDDAKQIIDVLMGRLDQNFNNSFILCKHTEVGRILKLLYDNGNYFGAGSIVGTQDGLVRVAGTPIIGVSFAKSADKILVIDADYVERVQTTAMSIEFSYEDYKNFTENKVTARIECQEELNLLRTDAHSYVDMGNSSSS